MATFNQTFSWMDHDVVSVDDWNFLGMEPWPHWKGSQLQFDLIQLSMWKVERLSHRLIDKGPLFTKFPIKQFSWQCSILPKANNNYCDHFFKKLNIWFVKKRP